MACIHFGGAIVTLAGPERKIVVRGKTYRFEMHPYCGPALLREDGEPRANQFAPAHKRFWDAVSLWAQQGERVDSAGLCVYDEPEPVEWEWRGNRKCVVHRHKEAPNAD